MSLQNIEKSLFFALCAAVLTLPASALAVSNAPTSAPDEAVGTARATLTPTSTSDQILRISDHPGTEDTWAYSSVNQTSSDAFYFSGAVQFNDNSVPATNSTDRGPDQSASAFLEYGNNFVALMVGGEVERARIPVDNFYDKAIYQAAARVTSIDLPASVKSDITDLQTLNNILASNQASAQQAETILNRGNYTFTLPSSSTSAFDKGIEAIEQQATNFETASAHSTSFSFASSQTMKSQAAIIVLGLDTLSSLVSSMGAKISVVNNGPISILTTYQPLVTKAASEAQVIKADLTAIIKTPLIGSSFSGLYNQIDTVVGDLTAIQGAGATIVSEQSGFSAAQNAAVTARATTVAGALSSAASQFKASVMSGDTAGATKTLIDNLKSIQILNATPIRVSIQTTPQVHKVVAAIADGTYGANLSAVSQTVSTGKVAFNPSSILAFLRSNERPLSAADNADIGMAGGEIWPFAKLGGMWNAFSLNTSVLLGQANVTLKGPIEQVTMVPQSLPSGAVVNLPRLNKGTLVTDQAYFVKGVNLGVGIDVFRLASGVLKKNIGGRWRLQFGAETEYMYGTRLGPQSPYLMPTLQTVSYGSSARLVLNFK